MYQNPLLYAQLGADGQPLQLDESALQAHFDEFYEDVYEELATFGDIQELNVCDNLGEHLIGNVYAKFYEEDDAERALMNLNGRFYGGRPLVCEFSPVTDFREARCRQVCY